MVFPVIGASDTGGKPGDAGDGSLAVPVHLIDLLDEEGEEIFPDDEPLLPFSPRQTCSECHTGLHDYDSISTGWHFNAADANALPGRPGQPWILVDAGTGTQIPLSERPWPGTFRPEQLGLTPSQFIQLFGRHMPGGGIGEMLEESNNPEEILRAFVTGKLEINCLICHNAHPGQDQAEYAVQIARQNFRWAATAACEFASVSGSTRKLPNTYDYMMPEVFDDPEVVPPAVTYRKNTFDRKNQVFFDIVRKVPNKRCYFCHSNVNVDKHGSEKWTADEDVHLAAGMSCVDCHRNGLDHNITRGYEGEDIVSGNPLAAVSTCRGCHLAAESSSPPQAGRLGAPVPKHPGIPTVHFDRLTCTACHSGPWPVQRTYRGKTSRAHALGTHNVNKTPEALPHITYPVFATPQSGIIAGYVGAAVVSKQDGKIGPHKLIWPAFWGTLKDQKVTPIALEIVRRTVGEVFSQIALPTPGDWPALSWGDITKGLMALGRENQGQPVYVAGGNLYRLTASGKLSELWDHPAAQPYLWPIAHNVRPAAQSLGVRACEDCHSTDQPFFFGEVAVESPIVSERGSVKEMLEFQDVSPFYTRAFAMSFVFRPWLKIVALISSAILAAVLLLYALKALACIAKVLVNKD